MRNHILEQSKKPTSFMGGSMSQQTVDNNLGVKANDK